MPTKHEDLMIGLVQDLLQTLGRFVQTHAGSACSDADMGAALATFIAYAMRPLPPEALPDLFGAITKIHAQMRAEPGMGPVPQLETRH